MKNRLICFIPRVNLFNSYSLTYSNDTKDARWDHKMTPPDDTIRWHQKMAIKKKQATRDSSTGQYHKMAPKEKNRTSNYRVADHTKQHKRTWIMDTVTDRIHAQTNQINLDSLGESRREVILGCIGSLGVSEKFSVSWIWLIFNFQWLDGWRTSGNQASSAHR